MTSTEATGKYQREHFPTKPIAHPKSVIGGQDGENYRITVLTTRLIRYEWADDGIFEDRASTFAINRDLPIPDFKLVDEDDGLEIITDKFHLRYNKKKFTASGFTIHSKDNVTDWKNLWRYGGGLKQEEYLLRGTARTLDEADGRVPLGEGILTRNGYSSIDDSSSMLFEQGGNIGSRRPGNRCDGYVFVFGWDFKDAMQDFFAISGHQPLLPRWALGNWWSRYYAYTDKSYLGLLDRFKEEAIPFSVGVLDMDWHWVEHERVQECGANGWTGYSWNTDLFPNPRQFLNEVHNRGLKLTPNDHPADGIAMYEDLYHDMCQAVGHRERSGDGIAFDIANKTFRDAFFDILLKKHEDDGVDFWWNDWQQGTESTIPGVDPLWVLNHFHFLNNSRDHKRPLGFSRFAGPGSHRYPVGFSGDSMVTWKSLDFQPEFTATSSNIGYGWWSHDIGGHMGGYRDDELAARWVQLGVFLPILRLHSSNNPWNAKEPWRFVKESRDVMIDALRLRHRFIPYLYSMNVKCARDGEPLVQPIYWKYPKNGHAFNYKNTYFFGSELFVAPPTAPRIKIVGRTKSKAWLPPSRHVDIFSGNVYDGDRVLWLYRTLEEFAVLAPEGAIIPLDAAEKPDNGCSNPISFELKVVVGANGAFDIHEDDGMGSDVREVDWIVTPLTYDQSSGTVTIGPASQQHAALPKERSWKINFISLPSSTTVTASVDGKDQRVTTTSCRQGVTASISAVSTSCRVQFSIGANPSLKIQDPLEDIFRIIDDAQMAYDPKQKIWETVKDVSQRLGSRLSQLQTMGYDEELIGAITECLCADSRWNDRNGD